MLVRGGAKVDSAHTAEASVYTQHDLYCCLYINFELHVWSSVHRFGLMYVQEMRSEGTTSSPCIVHKFISLTWHRFLLKAAKNLLKAAKICYQHLIENNL